MYTCMFSCYLALSVQEGACVQRISYLTVRLLHSYVHHTAFERESNKHKNVYNHNVLQMSHPCDVKM